MPSHQGNIFLPTNTRDKYLSIYSEAYLWLNDEQKRAVDAIEGPIMVIAGPGTGKTQILAVRIAKILHETDTQAHNILCLTFTDAATIAMRKRLVQIIGPEAHQVHIFTFHGFCNQVIQENLGVFGDYKQLEPITELEKVDVFQEIIDGLPTDHLLKRLKGDATYETRRLAHLYGLMKKENYNPDDIQSIVTQYLAKKKDDKEDKTLFYQRKYKGYGPGDPKPGAWDKLHRRMEELLAGATTYTTYQAIMERIGRYDYDDMIQWVLRAFADQADLLADYQERYHYFLVDEFQDTNGAQKEILERLISFWSDSPNLFVVGDDDQAIYKFQGANLSNMDNLIDSYNPLIVVLAKNYRSTQSILDHAMALIIHNTERLVNRPDSQFTKDLVAKSEHAIGTSTPSINNYNNLVQEQTAVFAMLREAHEQGEDLSEYAVIYRNHSQVDKLMTALEVNGIPLNIKRKIDILKVPLIANIFNILYYLLDEYRSPFTSDRRLFELMHYSFFGISPRDIALLAHHARSQKGQAPSYRIMIGSKETLLSAGIEDVEAILHLSHLIDKWIGEITSVTLQVFFQNILNEGQILQQVLRQSDKVWQLQLLSTLFDLIKEETHKDATLGLESFLAMIDKMKIHNIPLSVNKVAFAEQGVHFLTAHAAKGLEFDKVIVIGITKDKWEKSRGNSMTFTFPDTINADNKTNDQDERRLLYVAMTRARKELTLSYSDHKEDGKALASSQFIEQIKSVTETKEQTKDVSQSAIATFQFDLLRRESKVPELIDEAHIDRTLQGYKLSVTHLNKYLRCPVTFYFETILRVPMARTKYMGYGNAVHQCLERYYQELETGNKQDLPWVIAEFERAMRNNRSHFTDKEMKDITAHGMAIMKSYYNERLSTPQSTPHYKVEHAIDQVEYDNVPLKGLIDRVDIYSTYVDVVDYKTGKYANAKKDKLQPPSPKHEHGGDYWRQIVFYKILIQNSKMMGQSMRHGTMDFVEPDAKTGEFYQSVMEVSPDDMQMVGQQIVDVWGKIHNKEFTKGCGEDSCAWCNFVKNDYVFSDVLEYESEEDR